MKYIYNAPTCEIVTSCVEQLLAGSISHKSEFGNEDGNSDWYNKPSDVINTGDDDTESNKSKGGIFGD